MMLCYIRYSIHPTFWSLFSASNATFALNVPRFLYIFLVILIPLLNNVNLHTHHYYTFSTLPFQVSGVHYKKGLEAVVAQLIDAGAAYPN